MFIFFNCLAFVIITKYVVTLREQATGVHAHIYYELHMWDLSVKPVTLVCTGAEACDQLYRT